ncbi:MAG: IS1380 family transposase [Victivallaceae bacterium]|jgi:hypothetical protein
MYKIQGNEEITSNGGISLIGALLSNVKSLMKFYKMTFGNVKKGINSHSGIRRSIIGLLSLGRIDFADIKFFREDKLFRDCLKLSFVPSEEILRQRLDGIAADANTLKLIDDANVKLLSGVDGSGVETTAYSTYNVIDIGVSVLDNSNSKKEGVSLTYKEVDGYAPIFVHLGTHGYMLANELRNRSQHSAKGTSTFVRRCNDLAKRIGIKNILYRVDSGHDDVEFLETLVDLDGKFLVKRNLRSEKLEQWLAIARRVGACEKPRPGKKIFRGFVSHKKLASVENVPMFIAFEVPERLTDAKTGERFLIPELEVATWWTNLTEDAATCINLYHNHATSEQFHSELKTDMDIEMLPRSFDVTRRRLRSVMQYLICVGCKIVSHANSKILKFGRHCPYFNVIRELYAIS